MGHALSTFLREQAESRGMSGAVVADRAGLSRQLVSKWLSDSRPHITRLPERSTLEGFASAFGVSTEFLLAKAVESTGLGYTSGDFVNSVEQADDEQLLAEIARRLAASRASGTSPASTFEQRRQRLVEQGQPQQVAAYADPDRRRAIDDLVGGGLGPLDDEDDLQDPGSDEPA